MYSSDHISVFTSQSHVFLGRYARCSWLATQDLYPTPFPTLFSVAGTHKRAHKAGHAFKASTELGVAIWLSSGQRDWEHFRETSGKWFPPNDMIWVSQESSLTPLSTPLPPYGHNHKKLHSELRQIFCNHAEEGKRISDILKQCLTLWSCQTWDQLSAISRASC